MIASPVAALCALALFVLGPADEDPPEALALLASAEADVALARYRQAVEKYKSLAAKFPGTEAGEIGGRRSQPSAYLGHADLVRTGPSENRVDVVLMGEGYTIGELRTFDRFAAKLPKAFAKEPVLAEYLSYHNFIRAAFVSADGEFDAGTTNYDTALGAHDSGSSENHDMVAVDDKLVREYLGQIPGSDGYAVVCVRTGRLGLSGLGAGVLIDGHERTLPHEWGHAFGGLSEEASSYTGHRTRYGAPNVSETKDDVPWAHWLGEQGIGVFEGAGGAPTGSYRPANGCVMATGDSFCPVCREAVVLAIYRVVDPIESCEPEPHSLADESALSATGPVTFRVTGMKPKSHALEASFWIFPESEAPPEPKALRSARGLRDRRGRGPLAPIEREPDWRGKLKKGEARFTLKPARLAPGRWRVVGRVEDPAKVKNKRWVLADEHQLLASERAWWVSVE